MRLNVKRVYALCMRLNVKRAYARVCSVLKRVYALCSGVEPTTCSATSSRLCFPRGRPKFFYLSTNKQETDTN